MHSTILAHLAFVLVYFSCGWWLSVKTDKFAWIDVFWVSSFVPIIVYSLFSVETWPQVILHLMYLAWSCRLSILLITRVYGKAEDSRYVKLRNYWGHIASLYFYLLFLTEGALVLVLLIPIYLVSQSSQIELDAWNLFAATSFIIFLLGESLADWQRNRFAKLHWGQKKVCRYGLWKYSRHPNYFFEILIWYTFALFNLGLNQNLLSFLPAIVMHILIWKVTGVPPSRQQSLESRGEAYRQYMKSTNELIPWPPKEKLT
ncbi:MAG: DUF1295 domain-containing protein [Bdellovibrionales bacterium]|nr:DUF1295 domain-containing protein [Bdellovibrionales bacterium]